MGKAVKWDLNEEDQFVTEAETRMGENESRK